MIIYCRYAHIRCLRMRISAYITMNRPDSTIHCREQETGICYASIVKGNSLKRGLKVSRLLRTSCRKSSLHSPGEGWKPKESVGQHSCHRLPSRSLSYDFLLCTDPQPRAILCNCQYRKELVKYLTILGFSRCSQQART
jgi:hypothetical protein